MIEKIDLIIAIITILSSKNKDSQVYNRNKLDFFEAFNYIANVL